MQSNFLSYFGLTPENKKQQFVFKRELVLNKQLEKTVNDSLKSSNEGFSLFIPEFYLKSVKENKKEVYLRFIKISTILLVEHLTFFNAFKIKLNYAAKLRSVLFSFIKRIYDDLIDTDNEPEEVYEVLCTGKTSRNNPEYKLLAHLGRLIKSYAPPNEFKKFYALWPKAHETQSRKPENSTLEHLKEIAFQKARYSFLVDSYVMMNDLSVKFVEQRKRSAELFQCIDDLSDLKEDLANNRLTYINQLADPIKIIKKKYSELVDSLTEYASDPQLYLYLMKYFIERSKTDCLKEKKFNNKNYVGNTNEFSR